MQVVTISGFKGGTGKTTLASLLSIAAVHDGLKVACLDLDRNTRNFAKFLRQRREAGLPTPDHVMLMEIEGGKKHKDGARLHSLVEMARLDGYDLLVIDTSSGHQTDLYEAHLLADVIMTPMNESPADVHSLFAAPKTLFAPTVNYRAFIDAVRFDRRRSGRKTQRWVVARNRLSHQPTKIGAMMEQKVNEVSVEAGFEILFALRDRVNHRAISLEGRTALDAPVKGSSLSMSDLAGRTEARALLCILEPKAEAAAPAETRMAA